MFYRKSGQYKTSYRADQAIFTIPQDRVFFVILMALALVGCRWWRPTTSTPRC